MNHVACLKIIVFCLLFLAIAACGQSEKKAQAIFDQAVQAEQRGALADAVVHYQQVLAEFPKTNVAGQALLALQQIKERQEAERKKEQEREFRKASYQAVDSIVKVIDGYKAMFNRPPHKARDFDDDTFFFDTAYMAETVPPGYTVYLALGRNGAYRLWSFPGGDADVYVLDAKTGAFDKVGRGQAMEEITARFVEEKRKGGLVFLQAAARRG